MHSYAGGAMPSASLTADINNPDSDRLRAARSRRGLKPFVVTESGYHTALGSDVVLAGAQPGVSETAQAKYLPRHFCAYYNTGIRRTFAYEFVDEFPDYKDGRAAGHERRSLLRDHQAGSDAQTGLWSAQEFDRPADGEDAGMWPAGAGRSLPARRRRAAFPDRTGLYAHRRRQERPAYAAAKGERRLLSGVLE